MSSSQTTTTQQADLDAVVEALRSHDRFLVTTHENPDGDALGSLLAATLALQQLGKDAYMYLVPPAPLLPVGAAAGVVDWLQASPAPSSATVANEGHRSIR